jgi:hypothetical protein
LYKVKIYIWYQRSYWLQGDAFVAKGLAWVCDKPCYSGRFVVSILAVKRNGEKFKNRDRRNLMGNVLSCGSSRWKIVWWKRSVDHCGSRYYTYKNVNRRLGKVGLEGEEHNMVVSLIFIITECVREATTKELWNKFGALYQSKSLVNKIFLQKKLYNPRMKDGDSVIENLASECLQYCGKSAIIC